VTETFPLLFDIVDITSATPHDHNQKLYLVAHATAGSHRFEVTFCLTPKAAVALETHLAVWIEELVDRDKAH